MLWIAYARAGKEFDTAEAIRALGVECWCVRKVEAKRVGKKRRPEAVVSPYLRNYLFLDCAPEKYLAVVAVKNLAATMQAVGQTEARHVMRWIEARQAEYDHRQAQIDAGERLAEYQDGDQLEILRGPLAGKFATFRRIVERDHELFPRAEVEADMLGGKRRTDVDILDLRRAV
jgi:transcription antitermination factor NusG